MVQQQLTCYQDPEEKMDQKTYLHKATHCFKAIERPLKHGPCITSLQDLITALHKEFETNYVNIEIVNHIMLSYKSNLEEWKKFTKFDRYKYTRNLVDAGNGKFNLMILCWGKGHSSAIHDHSDSHCFMKMLKGDLKETRYEMPKSHSEESEIKSIKADISTIQDDYGYKPSEKAMHEIGYNILSLNSVAYINDNMGLHRVENASHSDTAVSLHLYCPPFDYCSMYKENSSEKIKCELTFWSKYGVRQTKNGEK